MKYLLLLLFIASQSIFAAPIGKTVMVKGQASATNNAGETNSLKRRSQIFEGDTLITSDNSKIQVRFTDNALLAIKENSTIKISKYHLATDKEQEKVLLKLVAGGFRTITGSIGKINKEDYEVETPAASIGIRGTNYELSLNDGQLAIGVYNGGVQVTNDQGSIQLGFDSEFSFAQVIENKAPIGQLEAPKSLKETIIIETLPLNNGDNEDSKQTDKKTQDTPSESSQLDNSESTIQIESTQALSNFEDILEEYETSDLNNVIENISAAINQPTSDESPLTLDLTQNSDETNTETVINTETQIIPDLDPISPAVTTQTPIPSIIPLPSQIIIPTTAVIDLVID